MSSRRTFLRACTAAGLPGLAGCLGGPVTTGEPHSATSAAPTEGTPPSTTPAAFPRVDWRRALSGLVDHRPALADGTLYVGDEAGIVTALDPRDGDILWRYELDAAASATPTVAGDHVLAVEEGVSAGGHEALHAIDAEHGDERWTFAPSDWFLDVLGTADGTAFVATSDDALDTAGQTLYALALSDGTPRWSAEVGDARGGLVTDDTVYVPSTSAVDAVSTDGTRRWHYGGPEYQFRSLAVAGDTVAFATGSRPEDWTIRGLDVASGEERWTFDDWVAYTTRAHGEALFVGGRKVARLDPTTGAAQWTADHRAPLYGAPVEDGWLYVGADAAAAIATDDGTVAWSTPLDAHLARPVGLAAGRLLVHESAGKDDRNRHLRALATDGGEQAWRFAGDAELTTPTVGSDRAYVAERGDLLALQA